jgi:CMP-N-acetylneuraminic acid synthetase
MRIFSFIFARGGSKGLPGKNIKLLNGEPLIAYSIKIAHKIDRIERVFVSTEDEEIAKIAIENGAEIIHRPVNLAQDDSPEWEAWKHAIDYLHSQGEEFDIFLSLPTTSPLRSVSDVTACLDLLDNDTDFVVAITESSRSPYFNMVSESTDGYISLMMTSKVKHSRRQDVPLSYDMTTIAYVARPTFILSNNNIFDGNVKAYKAPKERSIDIDTSLDFSIAEMLSLKG